MSQVCRQRCADYWTWDDLNARNISIVSTTPEQFFLPGQANPPLDQFDPVLLTYSSPSDLLLHDHISWNAIHYLSHLSFALINPEKLIEFQLETLKLCGFQQNRRVVTPKSQTIFVFSCEHHNLIAQEVGACVEYHDKNVGPEFNPDLMLLLLQGNETGNVEAHMVGLAIATFQHNNAARFNKGICWLDNMTIPCIIMSGTRPTFYLVPVRGVETCEYPRTETRVLKCETDFGNGEDGAGEGMENVEYRQLALRRFVAFKALAEHCWKPMLEGYRQL